MVKKSFVLGLLLLFPFLIFAQVEFEKQEFKNGNNELPYNMLKPKNFESDQKYPLLLFLHGAGERGSDNEKQLVHGGDLFLNALKVEGAKPRFYLYPGVNHNSWDNAFAEPDFLEWIYSQKKQR
jgi:predicted peptidase